MTVEISNKDYYQEYVQTCALLTKTKNELDKLKQETQSLRHYIDVLRSDYLDYSENLTHEEFLKAFVYETYKKEFIIEQYDKGNAFFMFDYINYNEIIGLFLSTSKYGNKTLKELVDNFK